MHTHTIIALCVSCVTSAIAVFALLDAGTARTEFETLRTSLAIDRAVSTQPVHSPVTISAVGDDYIDVTSYSARTQEIATFRLRIDERTRISQYRLQSSEGIITHLEEVLQERDVLRVGETAYAQYSVQRDGTFLLSRISMSPIITGQ